MRKGRDGICAPSRPLRVLCVLCVLCGEVLLFYFFSVSPWLEKERQVFAKQHILVEDDRPSRDLPVVADPAQRVLALTDQEVGLGLDPVAVDQKAAFDGDLVRLGGRGRRLDHLHVRHQVRDPRTNKWTVKFTQKFAPNPEDLSRTIITNIYLNAQEAETLAIFEANEIRKNRYPFEFEGRKFSVDMFLGELFGLASWRSFVASLRCKPFLRLS